MNSIVNRCLNPIMVSGTYYSCGRCPSCLRRTKNQLMIRTLREMEGSKLTFLTFTYDNEHCPIFTNHKVYSNNELVDETNDLDSWSDFFDLADYEVKQAKSDLTGRVNVVRRYKPFIEVHKESDSDYEVITSYPSLNYEDIKKLFKRFRKHFGTQSLTKYIIAPEYGSNGYRPHYHMLVGDLDDIKVDWLVSNWNKGTVDVRHVKGVDGTAKIGSYLAKYCVKGDYDCPYVKEGFVKKPRRVSSRDFGVGDVKSWNVLKSLLLDIPLSEVENVNVRDINPDDYDEKRIAKIEQFKVSKINGYNYGVPKYLIRKLMYYPVYSLDHKFICQEKGIDNLTYSDGLTLSEVEVDGQIYVLPYQMEVDDYYELDENLQKYYKRKYVPSNLQRKISSYERAIIAENYAREPSEDSASHWIDVFEKENEFINSANSLWISGAYQSAEITRSYIETYTEADFVADLQRNSFY